ncbi:MAG: ATP synthase F1 subunit gamma [Deltaproteobacteria bacterium]|jgi:F-type H+-transporting ATPase subunit gamma|nr:ATP synthase F1 subunit gamma [Deltaproteobacteria bacterium]
MPNLKSIKRKISSIKNTRQITKAMKMVAGSKLKRNQSAMSEFKVYASAYDDVIKNISYNAVLYSHPFYGKASGGNTGIIIISTDRGLCGSFNINLFKLFFEELKTAGIDSNQAKLYILGKKGFDFFKKRNYDVVFNRSFSESESTINLSVLLSDGILDDFKGGKIENIYIMSNRYISTLHQKAYSEKILPFETQAAGKNKNSGGYLVEPVDYEDEIIDKIFKDYIYTKIYSRILESFAGEQASRMNAMDNATRNAGKLINKLTVSYNKARQAAVTLEILDIINGMNAIK